MAAWNEETTVAVVGMGCRFPQANSIGQFWDNLVAGTDSVTPVPADRFDIDAYYAPEPGVPGKTDSRYGGFLDDPFGFDTEFFGISPADAAAMDPQHRLLLLVLREALDGAGIRPSTLAGTQAGVFIGQATAEYTRGEDLGAHTLREVAGSGVRAMAAGRISYDLDLRGPSVTLDAACSSSLVAVHMARQSLLTGESDLAVAGGANVILSPHEAVAYSQAAMLSPAGRCRFGDTAADGFVRSEGVAVVVLKRLRDALAAGDPVLALLPGSAVTNDGRASGSLIRPAVQGQTAMIRNAWRSAGADPARLDYVEAHGTGTPTGDEVELLALAEAVRGHRPAGRPLRIGSVKTNIGHAEAAAGIAGLVKTVLIVRHGIVPASLHATSPHPLLEGPDAPLRLVTANEPAANEPAAAEPVAGDPAAGDQPAGDPAAPAAPRETPVVAGVSSFGLSGTNAHVVVASPPPRPAEPPHGPAELPPDRPTHLLVLSAHSPAALRRLALAHAAHLAPGGAGRDHPLWDLCATAALHRDTHPHRLWATGADHDELALALRALAEDRPTPAGGTGEAGFAGPRRPVFVFPGQGAQWPGMGRSLLASSPAFRAALDACDTAVRAETGRSVRELVAAAPDTYDFPDRVDTLQPLLWSVQTALAAHWRDMGVDPEVCVGHSMGEPAAAATTGALSLADAAAVICRRSALLQRTTGQNAMLAVELLPQRAQDLIADEPDVCVAAENAPTSTVLAGDRAALRRIARRLEQQGVFHRLVRTNVASHCPAMDPLREDLLGLLAHLSPRPAGTPMHSTVRTAYLDGGELDAGYWADNLRRPVRFAESVRHLAKEGENVFVEISPHPLLSGAVEETLRELGAPAAVVTSTSRRAPEDEALTLARSLGAYFALGGTVHWERWFRGGAHPAPLPAYPWEAEPLRRPQTVTPAGAPVGRSHTAEIAYDHRVAGIRLRGLTPVPPVAHLAHLHELARTAARAETVTITRALVGEELVEAPAEGATSTVRIRLDPARPGSFTARVDTTGASPLPCLRAEVDTTPAEPSRYRPADFDAALARCRRHLTPREFLDGAARRGYEVLPALRTLRHLWVRGGEAIAQMSRPGPGTPEQGAWEACFLPLLAALPHTPGDHRAYTAESFGRVRFHAGLTEEFWVHATITPLLRGDAARAAVHVVGPDGRVLAEFHDILVRRVGAAPSVSTRLRSALGIEPRRPRTAPVVRAPYGTGPAPQESYTREEGREEERERRPADRADQFVGRAARVLGMAPERIDVRRSLRDYGIDSLTATQLSRDLRSTLDWEMPVRMLLGELSIRAITAGPAVSSVMEAVL
ncbi:beta-ketoacyl synthase N-terminal-like domain-containing protein [Streptomyces sp. NBC_00158]|uniref:type I polyketide synthase n=1 Tax=Streptomyces sp. NBC_00158 TaxID=2903627 RepID=UPI002F90F9B9